MDDPPICVAFLWHFHQPDYTRPGQDSCELPWARLHALKDYTDMVAWVEANPAVRVTFNWVPCLVQQVLGYAQGRLTDDLWEWTRRPAEQLRLEERASLLDWAFRAYPPGIIRPLPRYWELYQRRGMGASETERWQAAGNWSDQDLRDLQVCHLLGWCGESLRRDQPVIRRLLNKQRGFSPTDHHLLLAVHQQVLQDLLPRYRRLLEQDRIEIATSPFYHPILPLLCRMEDARVSRPDLPLPSATIAWREDAREHLRRARQMHQQVFGQSPQGLWPSEGGVSDASLELIAEAGFRWTATDDQILAFTLHFQATGHFHWRDLSPRERYRLYQFQRGTALVFRDHQLSDRIGFDYCRLPAEKAVADLKARILRAGQAASPAEAPPLIPIILDGENAWEYYPANGSAFLTLLYDDLTSDARIRLVTFSEYLQEFAPTHRLQRIFPGSWINHDFHLWAGHPEDNRAWEELAAARAHLQQREFSLPLDRRRAAWDHLLAAEGSDWYWWFGDEHHSPEDNRFDHLFRRRLQAVYAATGNEPPARLQEPIKRSHLVGRIRPPRQRLRASVDGRVTHFFEWQNAGTMLDPGGGTMHRTSRWVERLWFGFDDHQLLWRIDPMPLASSDGREQAEVWLHWESDRSYLLRIPWNQPGVAASRLQTPDSSAGSGPSPQARVGQGSIIEVAVAWQDLNLREGDSFRFALEVRQLGDQEVVERWPTAGWLVLSVPTREFDLEHWWV